MTETEKSEKLGDSVRAVERALDILKAFTPSDHQLTASELLKRVDLSRPTLYRLLRTLENSGFVMSSGDPQRFQLGLQLPTWPMYGAPDWTSPPWLNPCCGDCGTRPARPFRSCSTRAATVSAWPSFPAPTP